MFDNASRVNPWLVLRTKSRHENVVAEVLQQKQVAAYLPKRVVTRIAEGRRRAVEIPLFPGYVFLSPRADQYEGLRYIRGSCGLVLSSGRPAVLPDKDLDTLKMLVDQGTDFTVEPELVTGTRVEIASGSLRGVKGELVQVRNRQLLVINVDLVGSSVRVEVDRADVRTL